MIEFSMDGMGRLVRHTKQRRGAALTLCAESFREQLSAPKACMHNLGTSQSWKKLERFILSSFNARAWCDDMNWSRIPDERLFS